MPRGRPNTISDIVNNLVIKTNDSCWLYAGSQKPTKKGKHIHVSINGEKRGIHVWSYEHFIGPVPKDLCVLHKCDIPNCGNPNHLFLGTIDENNKDCKNKGRVRNKFSKEKFNVNR